MCLIVLLVQIDSVQPFARFGVSPQKVCGGMSRMPTVHFMSNSIHWCTMMLPVNTSRGKTSITHTDPVTLSWQCQVVVHLSNTSSVGKSDLLLCFSDKQWIPEDQATVTIGVDFQRGCLPWSLSNINLRVHRRKLVPSPPHFMKGEHFRHLQMQVFIHLWTMPVNPTIDIQIPNTRHPTHCRSLSFQIFSWHMQMSRKSMILSNCSDNKTALCKFERMAWELIKRS